MYSFILIYFMSCVFYICPEKGSVYNKKGRVEDVVSPFQFTVVMDCTNQLLESTIQMNAVFRSKQKSFFVIVFLFRFD